MTAANEPVFYIEPASNDGIPFDVFATLSQLLTAAWPDARMGPGRGTYNRGFGLVLPTRAAQPVTAEDAAAAAVEPDDDAPGVLGWDGKHLSVATPEELAQRLGMVAHLWLSAVEGAANYVEQTVTLKDDPSKRLVFSVAWSKRQTPHELRKKADARREKQHDKVQAAYDALEDAECWCPDSFKDNGVALDECARHGTVARLLGEALRC